MQKAFTASTGNHADVVALCNVLSFTTRH